MSTTGITAIPPLPEIGGREDEKAGFGIRIAARARCHRPIVMRHDLDVQRTGWIQSGGGGSATVFWERVLRHGSVHAGTSDVLMPADAAYLASVPRFTGLTRTIDFRYPSNRYVVLIAAAAGAVAYVSAPADTRIRAIRRGGWVDLPRMGARPGDRPGPSCHSCSQRSGGRADRLGRCGRRAPGISRCAVSRARDHSRAVRPTGMTPTTIDLVVNLAAVVWLASTSIAWVAGLALGIAIVLDTHLPDPAPPTQLWWGAGVGVAATATAGIAGGQAAWVAPAAQEWVPMVMAVTGAMFLIRPESVRSFTDTGNEPLDPRRLFVGRLAAVVSAVTIALGGGCLGDLRHRGPVGDTRDRRVGQDPGSPIALLIAATLDTILR